MCHKANQDEGVVHITQDVVRAIRVLPGHSYAMSLSSKFAIRFVQSNVTICKNTIILC